MATNGKTTRLGFVIDESGSMRGNEQAVVDGYNEFVGTLRREAPDASRVYGSLAFFDTHRSRPKVRFKREAVALAEMPELGGGDYTPLGYTPLNDAIVDMLEHLGSTVRKQDQVMVVIMTDGQENDSTTTTERVRELVAAREADGWEFIYLGANVDAFAEAQNLGMSAKPGSTYSFASSPVGTANTMKRAASLGSTYTTSGATGMMAAAAATPDSVAEDPEEFKAQQEAFEKARQEHEAKQSEQARTEASTAARRALGLEED